MTRRTFRVVVIGGGVVGCNILYHLSKAGWSDVALCERHDLTAGATWHSSGHISTLTPSQTLSALALTTRRMLRPLERESGQALGLEESGSVRLGTSAGQLREFERLAREFEAVGLEAEVVSATQTQSLWPLMQMHGVRGSLHVPQDCYLNAADFTQALAKAARANGAAIFRQTGVEAVARRPSGDWELKTPTGLIIAEHVVFATGMFARVSPLAAHRIVPSAVISHQYIVTAALDQVRQRRRAGLARLPILRQPDIRLNIREEGEGLFVSVYEAHAKAIFRDGPPLDFAMQLLPPDFDSVEDQFGHAIERVPCLGDAGVRTMVHGPMPWSPDFAPSIGPVPGCRNAWMAEGVSYGVTWSGGVAEILCRWMIEGDPGVDVTQLDCLRFGGDITVDDIDSAATASYLGSYNNERK